MIQVTFGKIQKIFNGVSPLFQIYWGWPGVAKVSCILRHWGIQLAYSWARPAILVAGKGRDRNVFYFFCFFTSIPVPLHSLSLSFISSTISSIFSPFLWERTQNDPQGLTCISGYIWVQQDKG